MSIKYAIGGLILAAGFVPALASAETSAYVAGSTELHAGPAFDYPTVDVVREGEGVVVHGCLRDFSWCDVGYRGDRGWIAADNLQAEFDSRRQPIVSVGPR